MEYVKLLIDVDAEGVHIPAGTVCQVENRNSASDEAHATLDLRAGDVLFWINESEATSAYPPRAEIFAIIDNLTNDQINQLLHDHPRLLIKFRQIIHTEYADNNIGFEDILSVKK